MGMRWMTDDTALRAAAVALTAAPEAARAAEEAALVAAWAAPVAALVAVRRMPPLGAEPVVAAVVWIRGLVAPLMTTQAWLQPPPARDGV